MYKQSFSLPLLDRKVIFDKFLTEIQNNRDIGN